MSETFTTPVGRLVEGSLYRTNETNMSNQPLVFKNGKNAGKPRMDYYFAIAIQKGSETHWGQTEWGKIIENVGKTAFPKGQWSRPDFSWKIIDGDSTVLNKANPPRRPCDKEGFAGNWIIKFGLPIPKTNQPIKLKIYNANGSQLLIEDDHVNLGDYIQVHALIKGNSEEQQAGVYLNPLMIAFSGYGPRITLGPDAKSVGFGQSPLPAGVSSTPQAAFTPPPVADTPLSYPQILDVPAAPHSGGIPAKPHMTAAARGLNYEQYKMAGWTDEQLIQHGLMFWGT